MGKKMTKQDLQNYIISEAKKLYKIEVLKERKESIDKELRMLNEGEDFEREMELGELTQDLEQGEWPKLGDIVKFKDNLADSYGNKYLVVSKGHGRHGHGELIAVSGDYGKYDDDISNTMYRVSDVFKTVAKTNQSWFLDELKHDIEYSDGNLSVQKIIDSALSGDI